MVCSKCHEVIAKLFLLLFVRVQNCKIIAYYIDFLLCF